MKILTITDDCPPWQLGGSGRIAWETSEGLVERGHEVHLLTAAPIDAIAPTGSVQVHLIPELEKRWAHWRSVFSRTRAREIIRIIDNVSPDLIHAHGLAWQMGYKWLHDAQRKGIPCVYTTHGVMHVSYGKVIGKESAIVLQDLKRARWTYNPLRNMLAKRALSHCTSLCVSDALRTYIESWGYKNLRTLRNGIDLSFWKSSCSQEEARRTLEFSQDQMIFLFAGRIGYDKGSSALDATLPKECALIVAGDIPKGSFTHINEQIRAFPNQSAEDMRLLYAACDAAIVPSVYLDPFPTVCLEAMACNRPVVATCYGGAKESVADGETGWIVDPLDEEALKRQLIWCRDHREEMRIVGSVARKHMEKHFSREHYLQTLLDIYKDAVAAAC